MGDVKRTIVVSAAVMMMVLPLSAFADEVDRDAADSRPKMTYDSHLARDEDRIRIRVDQRGDHTAGYPENRLVRQTEFLGMVETYAPDYIELYEKAFEDHNELHDTILETSKQLRDVQLGAALEEMKALRESLYHQKDEGEITFSEASEQLQLRVDLLRAGHEDLKESLDEEMSFLRTELKNLSDESQQWREVLKAAVEDGDTEVAEQAIVELYGYLLGHINLDAGRLEVLQSYIN